MRQGISQLLRGAILFAMVCLVSVPLRARADNSVLKITYEENRWFSSLDGGENWTEGTKAVEENVKDGDTLVIDGNSGGDGAFLVIKLNAKLKELAVTSTATASVTVNGVDIAYATAGSIMSLHSDAGKILAVPDATQQVEGNVGEVEVYYQEGKKTIIDIEGTIGKINVLISDRPQTIYNVAAGKFKLDDKNNLDMDSQYFSFTPDTTGDISENSNASTQETSAPDSEKQLDKVPKTGNRQNPAGIFFLLSGACAAGGIVLFKRGKKAV